MNSQVSLKELLIISIVILSGFTVVGQDNATKKPQYVIIVNNEIITKETLEEYGKLGLIKSMHKGVSQEERDELAKIFGDIIQEREFIVKIELLSEKEKIKMADESNETRNTFSNRDDELKLNVDSLAKNFTVEMIDGQRISLSDLKGKVILLNYWATWCAPCLMEFSEIPNKILAPFEGRQFVFIPIAIGEDKEKVKLKMEQMKKYNINFNVGYDPAKMIWNEYASGVIPKNFIIDKNGIIRHVSIGYMEGNLDKLAVEILRLLSE